MLPKDTDEERIKKMVAMLAAAKDKKNSEADTNGTPGSKMSSMKDEMAVQEADETPEDEAAETSEEQGLEDELGLEKHKMGKLFGTPRHGVHITIAMKGRK